MFDANNLIRSARGLIKEIEGHNADIAENHNKAIDEGREDECHKEPVSPLSNTVT